MCNSDDKPHKSHLPFMPMVVDILSSGMPLYAGLRTALNRSRSVCVAMSEAPAMFVDHTVLPALSRPTMRMKNSSRRVMCVQSPETSENMARRGGR